MDGHELSHQPKQNTQFWSEKIARNQTCDRRLTRLYRFGLIP